MSYPCKYSNLPEVYNTNNRLMYDKCAYAHRLYESTSPLNYNIFPPAYESCKKCWMPYVGFIGHLGGTGGSNPVHPTDIDLESDLRNQTRIASLAPRHKYIPRCNGRCKKNQLTGYPCSGDCQMVNTNNPPECFDARQSIVPLESVDSRAFKPCNNLAGVHINRFEPGLLEDPQHPSRIFKYNNARFRMGMDTNQLERDRHMIRYPRRCATCPQPAPIRCKAGSMGCQSVSDFNTGVFLS